MQQSCVSATALEQQIMKQNLSKVNISDKRASAVADTQLCCALDIRRARPCACAWRTESHTLTSYPILLPYNILS